MNTCVCHAPEWRDTGCNCSRLCPYWKCEGVINEARGVVSIELLSYYQYHTGGFVGSPVGGTRSV